MSRARSFTLGVLLLFTAVDVMRAQDPIKVEPRKIIATANATAFVVPDAARLTFSVSTTEGTDKSIGDANASHVKRIKDGITALKLDQSLIEMHVLPSTISTIVTSPQNPMAIKVPQSKKAQSIFQVLIRDRNLEKLRSAVARVAETAADLGATGLEPDSVARTLRLPRPLGIPMDETETVVGPNIEWLALSGAEARRTAVRNAYKEALADAQTIADQAKLTITEVTVTPEDTPLFRLRLRTEPVGPENAIIPVKVQVRVVCTY